MKVLIIEDHVVVREGVRKLLVAQYRAEILEAVDGEAGIELFRRDHPDLVMLDLNLAGTGGLEILRRLLAIDSKAKVLVFTTHSEVIYASKAMRAGARGYVSKSAPADELLAAVRKVVDGGQYIEKDLAGRMAITQFSAEDPMQKLSAREFEILRLLGSGASLSEIADGLGVAYKTVANTCSHIKIKLGVERTADLIRLAVENLGR